MKTRFSVARCCCDGVAPPTVLIGIVSANWEPGGSRFNVIANTPLSVFPAYWGNQNDFGTPFNISGAMRSNPANVPQGATIASCIIVADPCLPSAEGPSGSATCDVQAEASDTATVLTSAAQADAAPRGAAIIANYNHSVNEFNNVRLEQDVTALAQEMVNRPGWTTASAFQFFFDRVSASVDVSGVIVTEIGGAAGITEPQLELTLA